MSKPDSFNVVVAGAEGCGKSGMVMRLLHDRFSSEPDPTIEDAFQKTLEVDDLECQLELLDTGGSESQNHLHSKWFRWADSVVVVYATDSLHSFQAVKPLLARIRELRGGAPVHATLVGTKNDLTSNRKVTTEQGASLAFESGLAFREASAKEGDSVLNLFVELVREMRVDRVESALLNDALRLGAAARSSASGDGKKDKKGKRGGIFGRKHDHEDEETGDGTEGLGGAPVGGGGSLTGGGSGGLDSAAPVSKDDKKARKHSKKDKKGSGNLAAAAAGSAAGGGGGTGTLGLTMGAPVLLGSGFADVSEEMDNTLSILKESASRLQMIEAIPALRVKPLRNKVELTTILGPRSSPERVAAEKAHAEAERRNPTPPSAPAPIVAPEPDVEEKLHPRMQSYTDSVACRAVSTYPLKHATTGERMGDPICDQYAMTLYRNRCLMTLADGCNWGVEVASAARKASDAMLEYTRKHQVQIKTLRDCVPFLLRGFQVAHNRIVEGRDEETLFQAGTTTMISSFIFELDDSEVHKWAFVALSVGDCKALRWCKRTGDVTDLTEGNRQNLNDARDPGGRIGPYGDGGVPDLRNLDVYWAPLEEGDIVMLCSDGVHDNLDPQQLGKSPADIGIEHFDTWDAIDFPDGPGSPQRRSSSTSESGSVGSGNPPSEADIGQAAALHRQRLEAANDIRDRWVRRIMNETCGGAKTTLEGHRPDPATLCHRFVVNAQQLTASSRRFMQENPKAPLPKNYSEYPGKMDHTTLCAYRVGCVDAPADLAAQEDIAAENTRHHNAHAAQDAIRRAASPKADGGGGVLASALGGLMMGVGLAAAADEHHHHGKGGAAAAAGGDSSSSSSGGGGGKSADGGSASASATGGGGSSSSSGGSSSGGPKTLSSGGSSRQINPGRDRVSRRTRPAANASDAAVAAAKAAAKAMPWKEMRDKASDERYFFNPETGESVWYDPRYSVGGWKKFFDDDDQPYYVHDDTGDTARDMPDVVKRLHESLQAAEKAGGAGSSS